MEGVGVVRDIRRKSQERGTDASGADRCGQVEGRGSGRLCTHTLSERTKKKTRRENHAENEKKCAVESVRPRVQKVWSLFSNLVYFSRKRGSVAAAVVAVFLCVLPTNQL